jgi:small subunit ribosomal protein S16
MLAIRMQRVGRKGHAMYRLAVQEAQRHPSSGRVVAYVGTYDPHTKATKIQVEIAQKYLDNGAQPSPRVVKLLKDAGVKLPKWVVEASAKSKTIRSAEKLRKNQPKVETPKVAKVEKVEVAEEVPEEIAEEVVEPAPTVQE